MIRKKILGALLVLAFTVTPLSSQKKVIKDSLGFPYEVTSPPRRIVSLAPNITEILFALGLNEKIVGVTRYCDYPAEAREKEKIGGMIDPNIEKIISLKPDLIIGFRLNSLRVIDRLRSLHLPVFALETETSLESVFRVIEKIGIITQKEKKTEIFILSLKKKYHHIQSALRQVKHEPKVFLILHGPGLWTCGKENFLSTLIKKARGVNIAASAPRKWLLFNREQLIHKDPEIIIILSKSKEEFLKAKEWIKNEDSLRKIKAIVKERIYFLDENLAARPGPRLFDAFEEMARIFHPNILRKGNESQIK